ncbi:hypothetical protein AYI70_g10170 [Smittium culicis]|uniref:Uncharacterized protein n=1 Tax=Smittium culicis TaxID=133412 RepID=A0A1R1X7W0_9FUNG|nr:hypothetical protein AYI70_g10170 [Smittium culicis]
MKKRVSSFFWIMSGFVFNSTGRIGFPGSFIPFFRLSSLPLLAAAVISDNNTLLMLTNKICGTSGKVPGFSCDLQSR